MSVVWAWAGAVTPATARVVGKVTGASVRLAVATSADQDGNLNNPTFYGPVTSDPRGVVKLTATGLDPDTEYHWQLEDDGILDLDATGSFTTHPPVGQPASFTFATASCAGHLGTDGDPTVTVDDVSNHPVFDIMAGRAHEWLFFHHMGDLHYRDINADNVTLYRDAYNDVLTFNGTEGLDARQARFYRRLAVNYSWDDHDYGPNDSDRTAPGREAAQQAYREIVPHYPLNESGGIYHAWQIGRVLFVATDHFSHRDPNDDPDTADKTMLGTAQKAWLDDLLATTDAQALVWFTEEWAFETNSWLNYLHEVDELKAMFAAHGFLTRMITVSGDMHALAIDSGAGEHNLWGVPQFVFAAMDSQGGGPTDKFDLGVTRGRNRYGTIRVDDDGDRLTLTGTGWIGHDAWQSYSYTIVESDVPPAPGPGVALSAATIRPAVTWLGCDAATGKIIAELPDLTPEGDIGRALGNYVSASATVPIPLSGPGSLGPRALQATEPERTLIVAVINDVPAWAGYVLRRDGGTDAALQLGCVTPEGYLGRREVRNHDFAQVDEALIASTLARDAEDIDGLGQGLGLVHDIRPTGTLRDRIGIYRADDHVSVLQRLQELSAVIGGPEWTIDPEWADADQTAVQLVFRVASRIGVASAEPKAIFEAAAHAVFGTEGSTDASYTYSEDHAEGRAANYVVAYSSGEGDHKTVSAPAIDHDALAAGVPILQHTFSAGSNISDQATIDSHAQRRLDLLRRGARTWTITARWNAYPRYGVDWRLGDDVAWELVGHRHPDGVTGRGRVVGWRMNIGAGSMSPVLLDPTEGLT